MLEFIKRLTIAIAMTKLILRKGGTSMTAIYAGLIINDEITFSQVPVRLQPQVRQHLAALGLDENGNPL